MIFIHPEARQHTFAMDDRSMTEERRRRHDRRKRPTRPLGPYTFFGRRRRPRRRGEKDCAYVDRYDPHLLVMVVLLFIFGIIDTILSVKLIQLGSQELNVLMLSVMNQNFILSVVLKILITGGGAIILLVHKNFKLFNLVRTEHLLYLVFSVHVVLVVYELSSFVLLQAAS